MRACNGADAAKWTKPHTKTIAIAGTMLRSSKGMIRKMQIQEDQPSNEGGHLLPVGKLSAHQVPESDADPEDDERPRYGRWSEVGHLLENRRDVGEDTKHGDRGKRTEGEHKLNLWPEHRSEFVSKMHGLGRLRGYKPIQTRRGSQANRDQRPEGEPPSKGLAQCRAGRNSEGRSRG